MTGYTCTGCGETHHDVPFAYASPAPDYWFSIPEDERESRTILGGEQCEVDDQFFFVRAQIHVPVHDAPEHLPDHFAWGVWVSLSRASYERMLEVWDQPGREAEPPYFGWFQASGHAPAGHHREMKSGRRSVSWRRTDRAPEVGSCLVPRARRPV